MIVDNRTADTYADPCVRCGGQSDTTVRGRDVCDDCEPMVRSRIIVGR